eukprot:COSAG02_NODE_505_length_20935_cov_38.509119_10_plen_87_part_00
MMANNYEFIQWSQPAAAKSKAKRKVAIEMAETDEEKKTPVTIVRHHTAPRRATARQTARRSTLCVLWVGSACSPAGSGGCLLACLP